MQSPQRPHIAPVERDTILELRAAVLSVGGTRISAMKGDWSPRTRHWAAWIDGNPIGCASVMAVRGHALRGMAVLPEYQGQGIGTALLDAIHDAVRAPMWCNARLDAVPFYVRRGWVASGPQFEMDIVGTSQRMVWSPSERYDTA